ncbi:alpha-L-fucosidase [Pedobacter westerhofensis]|uniref:alpha-L-fucosidase n=2 Tax=Pedobacter westerhofensis TaxID=425512 RepID=A0A521F5S4_9SPHI|nr:alpha-L-fucosidase [Pedobacter westerhofensis]
MIIALCMALAAQTKAQTYTPSASNLAARKTFQDLKFGLFIHWGIYSELGRGEWVMNNDHISYDNYKRLADFFNPQAFSAHDWVMFAKNAGMKYITVTSRHHDGFSMFGTKQSAYNIVDATPYHKDPMMELAKECKKEGIELHFYYSLLDWGRADYAYGSRIEDGKPLNGNWDSYISFMKKQLTELITKYPGVKGIWFDGHWERKTVNWHYDEIYGLIHKLNPAILVGNNHHLAPKPGEDFQLFEKDLPGNNLTGFSGEAKIGDLPLETCETINGSWGFSLSDNKYKTPKEIIDYLVGAAGRNANFLLNIGPMPNGKIQQEFTDTMAVVGKWLQKNGESVYGTRGNLVAPQPWGVITHKNKTVYAHILVWPKENYIFIPKLKEKLNKAMLLGTKTAVKYKQQEEGVFIYLDGVKDAPYDTVIQLSTD